MQKHEDETGTEAWSPESDFGSNAELARSTVARSHSTTPFLDEAGRSPAVPGSSPLGFGLIGGLLGCGSGDLDQALDAAAAESSVLASYLDQLRAGGWTFAGGAAGKGTFTEFEQQRIVVDPNDLANPRLLTVVIAHEAGHALAGPTKYQFDASMTRQQYIDVNTRLDLVGEAEATIAELQVRDEMVAADPANDPGITGATAQGKIAAWEEFRAGRTSRTQLVDVIVNLFAIGEKPSTDSGAANYWDFYAKGHADAWDASHPTP